MAGWLKRILGQGRTGNESTPDTEKRVAPVLQKISDHPRHGVQDVLCDGYVLTGAQDLDVVQITSARLEKDAPGHKVLAVLDDPNQALYTNMHACMKHDLDADDFDAQLDLFRTKPKPKFEALKGRLSWFDDEDYPSPLRVTQDTKLIVDEEVLLFLVPVAKASEMIAAFPNGYFAGDLDPFENFALADHLARSYGLQLMGMGASYMALRKNAPLTDEECQQISRDVLSIYGADADPKKLMSFAKNIGSSQFLALRYTN